MSRSAYQSMPPTPRETGDLLAEFRTGSGQHKFVIVVLPFLIALFVWGWVHSLGNWDGDVAGVGFIAGTAILLGLAALCLVGWIVCLWALSWRLSLFRHGLVYRRGSSFRWIPWHDVARYHEREVILNGVPMGYNLYLYLQSGKKVVIEQFFRNTSELASGVKSLLVPELTQQAGETLGRNEGVDFQHVTLGNGGLRTAKESVSWKDIESLSIEDNKGIDYHVVVRAAGRQKPWLDVPVTAFPNLEVFFLLTERFRGT